MIKDGITMTVKINGRDIDEYPHNDQVWVEGRKGSDYELAFRNNTATRRKLVISVDGLNILTGKADWERGYVLDPWSSVSIPGWRVDNSEVANFVFASVGNTYNEQNVHGDKANIGVIGCMSFKEKPYVPVFSNYHVNLDSAAWPHYGSPIGGGWGSTVGGINDVSFTSSNCMRGLGVSNSIGASLSGASEPAAEASVGTGWGDRKDFKTKQVHYDFEATPSATLLMYYDSLQGLQRRGIDMRVRMRPQITPNPFPGYNRDGCAFPVRK